MNNFSYRKGQLLLFLLSFIVLFGSYYLQYADELTPCPLCLMQRLCTIFLTLLCLLACFLVKPKTKLLTVLQYIFSLLGIYFASRQLWLMSLPPDDSGTCLPGLNVMLRYFPLQDTLHALFLGSVECSENQWTWLGLSMPAWSLIYFGIVFAGIYFLHRSFWKSS